MPSTPKLFTVPVVIFLKCCLCFPIVKIRRVKLRFLIGKTISSLASLLLPLLYIEFDVTVLHSTKLTATR